MCNDTSYADYTTFLLYTYVYNLIPLYTIVNTTKNLRLYNWTIFWGGGRVRRWQIRVFFSNASFIIFYHLSILDLTCFTFAWFFFTCTMVYIYIIDICIIACLTHTFSLSLSLSNIRFCWIPETNLQCRHARTHASSSQFYFIPNLIHISNSIEIAAS